MEARKMRAKKFDISTENQRARLRDRLIIGPITTLEARHELDILGVAPRIYELRHIFGYNIKTHWIRGHNPGGGKHTVARYILFPGKWKGGKK
jgi:hypothetical protein